MKSFHAVEQIHDFHLVITSYIAYNGYNNYAPGTLVQSL